MKIKSAVGALIILAQLATPTAQPTPKPLKNPTAPHHHYDRRHPHRGAHATPSP